MLWWAVPHPTKKFGVAESRYEVIINRRGSHRQDACATGTQRKKRELVFIYSCLNYATPKILHHKFIDFAQ